MRKPKQNGYSLVEIIVYLAIFASISVLVLNSFIVVLNSFAVTRTNRDLLESGSKAMERMAREIRQARSVDVANSTLGSSPGVLQLNSTDSGGNNVLIKFIVSNGALNLYDGGNLIGNILGQNITINSLMFYRITTTNGEAVKIEFRIQDSTSKTSQTANFYDTIILRGGY